jgi:hypothetical protein
MGDETSKGKSVHLRLFDPLPFTSEEEKKILPEFKSVMEQKVLRI